MYRVIRANEFTPSENGTIRFEGIDYGSAVSMFIMNTPVGHGAELHVHPYSETWVVRAGRVRFTVGDEAIEAGPGDILVAGPNIPHGFKCIGEEHLQMICIHPSPQIIQEWVETS